MSNDFYIATLRDTIYLVKNNILHPEFHNIKSTYFDLVYSKTLKSFQRTKKSSSIYLGTFSPYVKLEYCVIAFNLQHMLHITIKFDRIIDEVKGLYVDKIEYYPGFSYNIQNYLKIGTTYNYTIDTSNLPNNYKYKLYDKIKLYYKNVDLRKYGLNLKTETFNLYVTSFGFYDKIDVSSYKNKEKIFTRIINQISRSILYLVPQYDYLNINSYESSKVDNAVQDIFMNLVPYYLKNTTDTISISSQYDSYMTSIIRMNIQTVNQQKLQT